MSEERESVIFKFWRESVVPAARVAREGVVTAARYARKKSGEYGSAALAATSALVSDKATKVKVFCNGFFTKPNVRAKGAEFVERTLDMACIVGWIGYEAVAGTRPKKFRYPNPWLGFRWIGPSDHPIYDGRYYDWQAGVEHTCEDKRCDCSPSGHELIAGDTIPDIRNDPKYKGCMTYQLRENDFIEHGKSDEKGQ